MLGHSRVLRGKWSTPCCGRRCTTESRPTPRLCGRRLAEKWVPREREGPRLPRPRPPLPGALLPPLLGSNVDPESVCWSTQTCPGSTPRRRSSSALLHVPSFPSLCAGRGRLCAKFIPVAMCTTSRGHLEVCPRRLRGQGSIRNGRATTSKRTRNKLWRGHKSGKAQRGEKRVRIGEEGMSLGGKEKERLCEARENNPLIRGQEQEGK